MEPTRKEDRTYSGSVLGDVDQLPIGDISKRTGFDVRGITARAGPYENGTEGLIVTLPNQDYYFIPAADLPRDYVQLLPITATQKETRGCGNALDQVVEAIKERINRHLANGNHKIDLEVMARAA